MLRARCLPLASLLALASPGLAGATTSSPAAVSPMAGNGHNVSFDGRVFIVTQGPADPSGGWFLMVFRPENVRYQPGGRLDLSQGAFTAPIQVQPWQNGENALALCEADPSGTPYRCDDAGAPVEAGPFACYDFAVLDSDAYPNKFNGFRRRQLKLWLQSPGTPEAAYYKHQWIGGMEPILNVANAPLRGIEPTVTRDGKLFVWQGHPDNDGKIDILMYATNPNPCAATGWDGPHNLSHLYNDPKIVGTYALGERQLRAADGTPYADGAWVPGAYPWLFPDGDALTFMATVMPCKGPEDPPGCGARRNALSVIGYPTNWGVAHVDGELNPSTQHSVRLFFSSPGRDGFSQLPLTGGKDVWPLFGSNTGNQADVVFDDGLDGNYGGVWHMNESITAVGVLDPARTPDTSGYFNTGLVQGATFPADNNGLFGKALQFDGQGAIVEVPHSDSLTPVNAMSLEMWIRPDAPVDCDGQNNYRLLLGKGNLGGPYSLVFEEGEVFQARVRAGGVERSAHTSKAAPIGQWSHVGFTYDGATGALRVYLNGEQVGAHDGPPAPLDGGAAPLTIGGPGGPRPACPAGDGSFFGAIDTVKLSRVVRDLTIAARPGNASRFVEQEVPPQVEAGAQFQAKFRLRNVGTTAWAPGMLHRLGSQAPADNNTWGTGRVELAERVEPGELAEVVATFVAPAQLGVYSMQWQLVHEGAEWFGEPTAALQVEVVPAGSLTTDGTTDGPTSSAGDTGGDPTGGGATGGATGGPGGGETDGSGATASATTTPGPGTAGLDEPRGDDGCACSTGARDPGALALLGLLALGRRRRRGAHG